MWLLSQLLVRHISMHAPLVWVHHSTKTALAGGRADRFSTTFHQSTFTL